LSSRASVGTGKTAADIKVELPAPGTLTAIGIHNVVTSAFPFDYGNVNLAIMSINPA
jgi:hypothetical protein